MGTTNRKKIYSAISFALSLLIFAFALGVFISALQARSQNRPVALFGYSFAVVVSGSMYPEIDVGELIIIRSCGIADITVGENAVFIGLEGEFKDKCIVHKVIEIGEEGGETRLVTKGVNNPVADDLPVTSSNFIGKEVYHSAVLGAIMVFLQNPINWLYLLVIVAAVAVLIRQAIKIIKYAKSKKDLPTAGSGSADSTEGAENPQVVHTLFLMA